MISNIEATNLAVEKTLSYLGAEIGGPTNKCHIEKRLRCARRSFYSLQSAGLKYLGVSPETAMTILKTSVDSTLSYSCHCTSLVNFMKELDKLQANLIIVVLGLSKYCHTTHLMQTTRIKPISHTIQILSLDLLWTCILRNSKTNKFCSHIYIPNKSHKICKKDSN